jgi:phosphate transport system substrate-binding protein
MSSGLCCAEWKGAIFVATLVIAFAASVHAAGEATAPSTVKGTGGSSSARVMAQWRTLVVKETKIDVEFLAANSDVGIAQVTARKVDFGNTEIPLSAEELAKTQLVQFPLLVGGVVMIVNVPGVDPGVLRLNPAVISKIYFGEIKFWNDDDIRAANPGLNLPHLSIRPVVRETAASTTLALTTYLAKADRTWASRVGANKQPAWPVPTIQAATVQAMGEKVQSTPGAIGYINFDEAYRNKLAYVQLPNRTGRYVKPSHETILATMNAAGLGRSEQIPSMINVEGDASWPIVEVTYVLVDRKPKDLDRARSTLKFFFWAFLQGDRMAAETGFVPLPSSIQARVIRQFRDVVASDNRPLDFLR